MRKRWKWRYLGLAAMLAHVGCYEDCEDLNKECWHLGRSNFSILALAGALAEQPPPENDGSPGLLSPEQALPRGLRELQFGFFGSLAPVVQSQNFQIESEGVAVHPTTRARDRILMGPNASDTPAPPLLYFTNGPTNEVQVFDRAAGQLVGSVRVGVEPKGIVISPDGRRLYVANSRGSSVSVVDTESLESVQTISIPGGGAPAGIDITPDGAFVYVTSMEDRGKLHVLETATGLVVDTLKFGRQLVQVRVSPDGTLAYVTSNGDGRVFVIDVLTNEVIRILRVRDAYGVAFHPTGDRVFITGADVPGKVAMFSVANHRMLAEWEVGDSPLGVALDPAGRWVYVTNSDSDFITVIDPRNPEISGTIEVGPGMGPITLLPPLV